MFEINEVLQQATVRKKVWIHIGIHKLIGKGRIMRKYQKNWNHTWSNKLIWQALQPIVHRLQPENKRRKQTQFRCNKLITSK